MGLKTEDEITREFLLSGYGQTIITKALLIAVEVIKSQPYKFRPRRDLSDMEYLLGRMNFLDREGFSSDCKLLVERLKPGFVEPTKEQKEWRAKQEFKIL